MFEWLDGYWTAMRHMANAKVPVEQGPHPVEWLAAAGSAGAAIAAALAAWLTWRVAHQQKVISAEREGADIMQDAGQFFADVSNKRLETLISYHRMRDEEGRHVGTEQWRDLVNEVRETANEYAEIAGKVNFIERLAEPRAIDALKDFRVQVPILRVEVLSVDVLRSGQEILAEKLRSQSNNQFSWKRRP